MSLKVQISTIAIRTVENGDCLEIGAVQPPLIAYCARDGSFGHIRYGELEIRVDSEKPEGTATIYSRTPEEGILKPRPIDVRIELLS